MAGFQTYQNYASHGRVFNTTLLTLGSMFISLSIAYLMYIFGLFKYEISAWISGVLILIPLLVFVANWFDYSLRIAYYKSWGDRLRGRIDRRKLVRNLIRTYKMDARRKKVEDLEIDGRWNFKTVTTHIKRLTEERDHWVSLLYEECIGKIAEIEKEIIAAKEGNSKDRRDLDLATLIVRDEEKILGQAKSKAEIYYQRQRLAERREDEKRSEHEVMTSDGVINVLKTEKYATIREFKESAARIIGSYNSRYEVYTEQAVKTLNRINGLRYEIAPMDPPSIGNFKKGLDE